MIFGILIVVLYLISIVINVVLFIQELRFVKNNPIPYKMVNKVDPMMVVLIKCYINKDGVIINPNKLMNKALLFALLVLAVIPPFSIILAILYAIVYKNTVTAYKNILKTHTKYK